MSNYFGEHRVSISFDVEADSPEMAVRVFIEAMKDHPYMYVYEVDDYDGNISTVDAAEFLEV